MNGYLHTPSTFIPPLPRSLFPVPSFPFLGRFFTGGVKSNYNKIYKVARGKGKFVIMVGIIYIKKAPRQTDRLEREERVWGTYEMREGINKRISV